MNYSVQRIDTTPIQPIVKRKQRSGEQAAEFERELEGTHGETPSEQKPEPGSPSDTPVAPRLEDEAGGSLDLTA